LLLLVLFGSVPDARPQILSLVFDSMAQEDATPAQRRLWCGLLGAMASTHLHALHTHSAQLVDWTCCLPSLPAEAGRRVLAALMPCRAARSGIWKALAAAASEGSCRT